MLGGVGGVGDIRRGTGDEDPELSVVADGEAWPTLTLKGEPLKPKGDVTRNGLSGGASILSGSRAMRPGQSSGNRCWK